MAITSLEDLIRHDKDFGRRWAVGADEAGRGAWAGPIVGAAVAIDLEKAHLLSLEGIADSKKLTPAKREKLLGSLIEDEEKGYIKIATCVCKASEIDQIGIQACNLKVLLDPLTEASKGLVDAILLADAFKVPNAVSIIKGDAKSAAIASASIIAKTLRDKLMQKADKQYPLYGFAAHKGYGAKAHTSAILSDGLCEIHRKSFKLPGHEKVPFGSAPVEKTDVGFFDTTGF